MIITLKLLKSQKYNSARMIKMLMLFVDLVERGVYVRDNESLKISKE